MPKIDFQIRPSAFELFRDRIFDILVDEASFQTALQGVTFYCERAIALSDTETDAINISCGTIDYDGKHSGQSTGANVYFIDCYSNGITTAAQRGDYLSSKRSQQLAGIVRYILEDTRYRTLGYAAPSIKRVYVRAIRFSDKDGSTDKAYSSVVRIEFVVESPEINSLIEPVLMEGYQTTIKIADTNSGYFSTT
jgi:hypothetical protein